MEYEGMSGPDIFDLFKMSPFEVLIDEVDEYNRETVIALLKLAEKERQRIKK